MFRGHSWWGSRDNIKVSEIKLRATPGSTKDLFLSLYSGISSGRVRVLEIAPRLITFKENVLTAVLSLQSLFLKLFI